MTAAECLDIHPFQKFYKDECVFLCPKGFRDPDDLTAEKNRYNVSAHQCAPCEGMCSKRECFIITDHLVVV